MKRVIAFLALSISTAAILTGCGGDDNGSVAAVTPRYVPVTLTVNWQQSRAVTASGDTQSVVVRITDLTVANPTADDLVTVATINRDTTKTKAYKQVFTTSGVVARPNQHIDAQVQFWSEARGQGTLLGSIKKSTTLPASGDLGDFNSATGKAETAE